MWLLSCFCHQPLHPPSQSCPLPFLFITLWANLLHFLDFSIYMLRLTHHALLSKELQSFPRFLCYGKRNKRTILDGENSESGLQKNNSCVAGCFWCAYVGVEGGLGSLECPSVHLPCVCSKVSRKLVFEPQTHFIFKCISIYNQCGFVEGSKVCGILHLYKYNLVPVCAPWKQGWVIWPVVFFIQSWFCISNVIVAQTVPGLKVSPFLCSEVLELYILNAVLSPFQITALISLLLHIQMIFSFTSGVSSSPFPARKELVQPCTLSWGFWLAAWIIYSWPVPSGECSAV